MAISWGINTRIFPKSMWKDEHEIILRFERRNGKSKVIALEIQTQR